MNTVGNLVDRVLTDYLEPPDELWVRTRLTAAVDDTTADWPIDLDQLAFEERDLLSTGVLVEVGSEQALVVDLVGSTLTVRRGIRGTTRTSHNEGDEVLVAPAYTRKAVFEAVAEAIVGLHPPLFTLSSIDEEVGDDGITLVPDEVITVKEVRRIEDQCLLPSIDLGDWESGRAIQVFLAELGDRVWITYYGRFPYPVNEGQTLAQLGIKDEWSRIVVVDALAQLISSRPLSLSQQEFVSGQLRTEGWPIETPSRLRDSLLRYREYLAERASSSLLQQHPPTIVYTA